METEYIVYYWDSVIGRQNTVFFRKFEDAKIFAVHYQYYTIYEAKQIDGERF